MRRGLPIPPMPPSNEGRERLENWTHRPATAQTTALRARWGQPLREPHGVDLTLLAQLDELPEEFTSGRPDGPRPRHHADAVLDAHERDSSMRGSIAAGAPTRPLRIPESV